MFSNYLKIALRNLLAHKIYSAISIIGFAIGLAATLLIVLYLRFEMSFDEFQVNGESLVRVSFASKKEGTIQGRGPSFTPPFAVAAAREIPEVQSFVRVSTPRVAYVSVGGEFLRLDDIRHADSTFFDVFSFELVEGEPKTALKNPFSLVLTQSSAQRLFGTKSPLGTLVNLDGKGPYQITGIAKDPPANSSIQFSSLISFTTLYQDPNLFLDWNGGNQYIAYLQLAPGSDHENVEKQCAALLWRHVNQQLASVGVEIVPSLEPLQSVHLFHEYDSENLRSNLATFGIVAAFILLLACVNFVNLSTARAIRRAKEVGVRKTFGAGRRELIIQFLGEALCVTVAGAAIAVLLVELVDPWYAGLVGERVGSFGSLRTGESLVFVLFIITVGIVAGSLPAFHLSRFRPVALQGTMSHGRSRSTIRNILVVFQFAVSITLIVCTFLVGSQLDYMRTKDLGFQRQDMIVIPLRGDNAREAAGVLKREFSALPGITGVTASSEVPSAGFTSNGYFPQGQTTPVMIHVVDIDEQFLNTYGISMVSGRGFAANRPADKDSYLINESLAATLGWADPLGKTIRRNGDHSIIGVVKDFHYATLHDRIEPLIFTNRPWRDQYSVLTVHTASNNTQELIRALREVWQRVIPSSPFEFSFLDQEVDTLYGTEERFEKLFASFSSLAIVIALLGLLGLASFATEQRTKEVGIRKVLGASASGIVAALTRDFVKLIVAANILGWPVAYFFMGRWLENFAYRTEPSLGIFVLTGAGVLVLALAVIVSQSLRTANANPIIALRYE